MNNTAKLTSSLYLFLLVASASPFRASAQPEVIDRIVAVVGKEPILLSDLNAQVEFYAFNNRIDPNTPGLKNQVLDAMVNDKLMLAKALEDTTISVSEDEVSNQLEGLIAARVQQVGSEKKLEELYGMPISRMKWEFRDETRKQLYIQALQQQRFGEIQASRREVEEFFTEFKDSLPPVPEELELYHIFMAPSASPATKNAQREFIQKILDSLQSGSLSFEDAAKRYSEDPGTASSGGDLGFVRRGEFFSEFEEAVFSLREKQFSPIVETPLGFHIIQLLERRGEQVHPRHILFRYKRGTAETDSLIAFLKSLKDSVLRYHAGFQDLAKRHSEDKQTGPLGGFLGLLPAAQFERAVLDVVKDMKDGDISDPTPVPGGKQSGFQIIYLKKRTPEHIMNLQDDWKRLEQLTSAYKRNNEYQQWLKGLRGEIYWDIRL